MGNAGDEFAKFLVQKKIISPEQLEEAKSVAKRSGGKLQDAIIDLGFATAAEVMAAMAEHYGIPFIDLTEVTIPQAVIELVPESVARENSVLPMAQDNRA